MIKNRMNEYHNISEQRADQIHSINNYLKFK